MFAERYKPLMVRSEQRRHFEVYLEGLVSGLERKSIEPIATAHGLYRRPLQRFVGAGRWDDGAFLEELRTHVGEEIGERDAGAPADIPAWCRMTGHTLVSTQHPVYLIQRKED